MTEKGRRKEKLFGRKETEDARAEEEKVLPSDHLRKPEGEEENGGCLYWGKDVTVSDVELSHGEVKVIWDEED